MLQPHLPTPLHVRRLSFCFSCSQLKAKYPEAAPISRATFSFSSDAKGSMSLRCLLLVSEIEAPLGGRDGSSLSASRTRVRISASFLACPWVAHTLNLLYRASSLVCSGQKVHSVVWCAFNNADKGLSVFVAPPMMRGLGKQHEHMLAADAEELLALISTDGMVRRPMMWVTCSSFLQHVAYIYCIREYRHERRAHGHSEYVAWDYDRHDFHSTALCRLSNASKNKTPRFDRSVADSAKTIQQGRLTATSIPPLSINAPIMHNSHRLFSQTKTIKFFHLSLRCLIPTRAKESNRLYPVQEAQCWPDIRRKSYP